MNSRRCVQSISIVSFQMRSKVNYPIFTLFDFSLEQMKNSLWIVEFNSFFSPFDAPFSCFKRKKENRSPNNKMQRVVASKMTIKHVRNSPVLMDIFVQLRKRGDRNIVHRCDRPIEFSRALISKEVGVAAHLEGFDSETN